MNQDELLARARDGDLEAFNQLVLLHQALVFNLCYRLMGHRQAAEDAAQEAFLAAWRRLGSLRGQLRPWLLRIASNACLDEQRRRSRRPSGSLELALESGVAEPADPAPALEAVHLQGEMRRELETALSRLPQEQRLALILCDVEGLDYAEIAAVAGVSLGTVKSRISRAREKMRGILSSRGELLAVSTRPDSEGS